MFLGTEKYPEENGFEKFLKEHGGTHNAYTAAEHTNYHFDITPANLGPNSIEKFSLEF